ncbi:MAG: hypothetical protein HZB47_06500 [Nitrosomonadales bacterium]|nr:hypothetical protein [Nitrosomonadales bacterium]
MNERLRLPISILASLLLHIAVLMLIAGQLKERVTDGRGLLQVFLQNKVREQGRPLQLAVSNAAPAIKNPQVKAHKPAAIKLPQSIAAGRPASGRFRWQPPPANQQDELTSSMQIAQFAQQRESRKAGVMAGLSNLAAQLRPLVKTRIACTQQADNEINCLPEPEKNLRPLLEQLFGLAIEARRLGVAENPLRMEFGPEAGVSVMLRQ